MKSCWVVLVKYMEDATGKILNASISQEAYEDLNDAVRFVESRNHGVKGEWIKDYIKVVKMDNATSIRYEFKNVSIV